MAIKFDLTNVDIPSGATVEKAEMSLYSYNRYGTESSTSNGRKDLFKITESWSESQITYRNLPSTSSSAIASSNVSNIRVWEKFDVTDEIKAVVENNAANHGFMLKIPSYSKGVSMRSSEYTDETYRPKLVLTIKDDNAPTVEVKSPGGDIYDHGEDVEIVWEAEDTKGPKAIVKRKIEFSSDNGSTWTVVDEANGNTGTFDWTAPTVTSTQCLIKVTVTDAGDNEGSDVSTAFEIKPAVGIITNNKFYLPMAKEYDVKILTLQGRELASFKVSSLSQLNSINIPLSSGMHIMKISALNKSVVRKIYSVR